MLTVVLPDKNELQFEEQVTPLDVAKKIGPRLAKAVVAAEVDGVVVGLDFQLPLDGSVEFRLFTKKDKQALDVMRHSCAHIMARAVMRIHEGVKLAFGPTVEGGFYYDFDLEHALSEDDFPKIEKEMKRIIELNEPFERIETTREDALKICHDMDQGLKVEHLDDGLKEHESLSFYRQGEFIDLCRGPHVPAAGMIGAFKLQSVAGAYWKGDQSRQTAADGSTRTAFFSQAGP